MKTDINLNYAHSDLKEIYSVICEMKSIDIRDRNKTTQYVDARAIFFALSKKLTRHSHSVIGSFLNRDHATSIHGIKTFNNLMATDKDFRDAARFALFKSCDLLEKVEEEPRDFIFLNWSKITNKQQMKIKQKMSSFLYSNELLKKESYV
tara:strand:+ start:747 stop:1196 length:450 start_codon:yes stop_codon:yes gene_type:complete